MSQWKPLIEFLLITAGAVFSCTGNMLDKEAPNRTSLRPTSFLQAAFPDSSTPSNSQAMIRPYSHSQALANRLGHGIAQGISSAPTAKMLKAESIPLTELQALWESIAAAGTTVLPSDPQADWTETHKALKTKTVSQETTSKLRLSASRKKVTPVLSTTKENVYKTLSRATDQHTTKLRKHTTTEKTSSAAHKSKTSVQATSPVPTSQTGPRLALQPSPAMTGTYSVSNRTADCIKALTGLTMMVTNTKTGELEYFNIDPNATHTAGYCGYSQSMLNISFDGGFVKFTFTKIQMKDFRFSYKFKMACKEDVLKLCPNIKKKVDVVICLSTTVRNDTLQDAKEHRVSVKCRKQLRVEELEMTEDIRLEPDLHEACKTDIKSYCQNVPYGNAQIIECLKENKKQLSSRCHQKVFKLQETEMMDPELDYTLMRVCKQMIKRFCPEADAKNMLQCLKQNKNSEVMDPKCKQMITKRQITQNTDYRLNPVLRKACKADIPKFCQSILSKAKEESELEGQVISCLKLKYADQRLSSDCEDQIRVIIEESALDYRLDPQLQMHCSEEIFALCAEEAAAQEQTGQVEECLKVNLLKIKAEMCKKEVLNMLKESKADIFVDPVLHTACALDIKHHCAAITPGRGRQMSCLMEALEDKRVRLQPECKKRLNDRIEMWSFAAKVAPAEGFSDLAMQVVTSPSKNYILSVISAGICVLFLIGLMCGRITKRVTRELKDR